MNHRCLRCFIAVATVYSLISPTKSFLLPPPTVSQHTNLIPSAASWVPHVPKSNLACVTTSDDGSDELDVNITVKQGIKGIKQLNANGIINTALISVCVVLILSTLASVDSEIQRGWTSLEIASRLPLDNWSSYSAVLAERPLRTKAITSATVYAIGDGISQISGGADISTIDRGRVLRSTLAGLLGHGPLSHLWYEQSESLFKALNWEGWMWNGVDWSFVPKVVVDQTTWGPFWNNVYILMLGAMQLRKPKDIIIEMKETTVPLIVSGLKLWPLAHCVTYGLVPLENRLLWVDMVEIVWVTVLANKAAEGNGKDGGEGDDKDGIATLQDPPSLN